MYVGGSVWQPPSLNPFGSQVVSTGMTASAALASASTANVQGNILKAGAEIGGTTTDSLTAKKNMLLKHLLKEEGCYGFFRSIPYTFLDNIAICI